MNITKFDKKCKCGPEFVCVRILSNCDTLKVGNIWISSDHAKNDRLAHAIVEDVGSKSKEEYGIEVGDYVLIDRLSTFAHTAPVALLKYNNVIVKTNADKSDFWPLKNMLFVEPETKDPVTDVGGIYVPNYQEKLNIGTVLKENVEADKNCPFKVGDKVLLVKGGDVVDLGDKQIHIFKHDMIICSIED